MKLKILLSYLVFCLSIFSRAQLAYNKGFEITLGASDCLYWATDTRKGEYIVTRDSKIIHGGKYSLHLNSKDAVRSIDYQDAGFFSNTNTPVNFKGKKKITLEAWVKTIDRFTQAGIWLDQVFKDRSPLRKIVLIDTLKTIKGWQLLRLNTMVDSASNYIYFGGVQNGKGNAWFDDFNLFIDDKLVTDIAVPFSPVTIVRPWLQKRAIPLNAVDSIDQNNDLDTLTKWADGARIIALGEPTHGTSEALRMRLRLFQYLVYKKGFNTLMLEDALPEAGLINDYVLFGKDTAFNIMNRHFFMIGRNEELLNLIEWMRSYNLSHSTKLQFRGMDIQSVKVALPNVARFAKQYDTALLTQINLLLEIFKRNNSSIQDTANRRLIIDSLKRYLYSTREYIDKNTLLYYNTISKDTVNWLALNAAVMAQCFIDKTEPDGFFRDSCMARNVIDYCNQYPEAKMLIWEHNNHVTREPGHTGEWLNKYFGKSYFPIAFTTSYGNYTAQGLNTKEYGIYALEEPFLGTAEYYLQNAGSPNFILSLKHPSTSWLEKEIFYRQLSFREAHDQFFKTVMLSRDFDALIFVKQTTHSHSYMLKK